MKRSHERQNAQTSRAGWRPKRTNDYKLVLDIIESMRQNPGRDVRFYTTREKIVKMVNDLIGEQS